ncbi:MAG: hypothetical protein EAZ89_19340 [Bacteroidetes bacterium]|nr:MAG: hypothetical protein EAZ89_19340 [Bacteroidota bacterium]
MKKRIANTLWISLATLTTLFLWGVFYMFNSPFERIQKVEDNDALLERYLYFYEVTLGEYGLDLLLYELVTVNESYGSLCDVAAYIERKGKCEFLPYLDAKCRFYESMPRDTVLRFTRRGAIFNGGERTVSFSHFIYGPDICTVAAALRKKCEAQYGSPDLFPTLSLDVENTSFKEYIRRTLSDSTLDNR